MIRGTMGHMTATAAITAFIWCSSLPAVSAEVSIDLSAFIDHGNPWGQKASVFMRSVNRPNAVRSFDWVTEDARNEARYPKWTNSPEITLWNFKVWESLADFENGELIRLKVSLYNKGDVEAGGGTKAMIRGHTQIVKLLKAVDAQLVNWSGKKGRNIRNGLVRGKGVTNRGKLFIKDDKSLVSMMWSYSGRSRDDAILEYVTLVFKPLTRKNDPRIPHMQQRSARRDPNRPTSKGLASHVVRTFQGDVYIDEFPMVDQGAKGYCAVATVERILRYYGSEADQHVLAQLADSSGSRGTGTKALYEALRKAGTKLGISVRDLQGMEYEIDDWKKLAKNYNRQARREHKPIVEESQWTSVSGRSVTYNFGALIDAFDWDVYTDYKLKQKAYDLKKFRKHIKENIDAGIPLVWSVLLGKVPEPRLAQASGGHMRTIIGYNAKNDEVIYSDSWGPGHEFKKMAMPTAFTITTGLNLLAPRLRH